MFQSSILLMQFQPFNTMTSDCCLSENWMPVKETLFCTLVAAVLYFQFTFRCYNGVPDSMLRCKSTAEVNDSNIVDIQYILEVSTSVTLVYGQWMSRTTQEVKDAVHQLGMQPGKCKARGIRKKKGKTPYDLSV